MYFSEASVYYSSAGSSFAKDLGYFALMIIGLPILFMFSFFFLMESTNFLRLTVYFLFSLGFFLPSIFFSEYSFSKPHSVLICLSLRLILSDFSQAYSNYYLLIICDIFYWSNCGSRGFSSLRSYLSYNNLLTLLVIWSSLILLLVASFMINKIYISIKRLALPHI